MSRFRTTSWLPMAALVVTLSVWIVATRSPLRAEAPTPANTAASQKPKELSPKAARANELVALQLQYAVSLAERGAVFSANARFVESLTAIARLLDADLNPPVHEPALARGLTALKEADDFSRPGPALEAKDVARVIARHQTPVLKAPGRANVLPVAALREYYSFAQQQLLFAAGGVPAASKAYYGMARIETIRSAQDGLTTTSTGSAKAFLFYQLALAIDETNYAAANEVGVLLARFGRLQEARDVLEKSVLHHPQFESCQNLSKVYAKFGERQKAEYLAKAARDLANARRAAANEASPSNSLSQPTVRWVSTADFIESGKTADFTFSPIETTAAETPAATRRETAENVQDSSLLDRASSALFHTFGGQPSEPAPDHNR